MSIVKRFLLLFVPLAILLVSLSVLLYVREAHVQQLALKLKDASRLNTQREVIDSYIQAIATDVLTISKHYELRVMLDHHEAHYRESLAREFLWFSRIKKIYDQVRFLDATGMEILRVNYNNGTPAIVPFDELQPKGERYYFKDTIRLDEGDVFVSPFDLNIEHGKIERPLKPMIRFGTPVYDSRGIKRGVVLLNYLGSNLLDTLEKLSKGSIGAILLLNSKGYYLRGMHPDDQWGFMYADRKDRTFARDFPVAWKKIIQSESGQFSNGRGIYTFTTIRPFTEAQVSSTGSGEPYSPSRKMFDGGAYYWKLVSFISPPALSREGEYRLLRMQWVLGTMLFLLALGALYVAHASVRRKQAEAEVRRHRDHLKQEVEQRTAELRNANEALRKDIEARKRMEAEKAILEKQLLQTQKMEAIGTLAGGVAHDYNNMLSVIIGYAEIALDAVDPEDALHDDIQQILTAGMRSKEITRQLLAFARQQEIAPQVVDLNAAIDNMLKMLRRLIGEHIDFSWNPREGLWPVKIDPAQIDQILANLCVNARDAIGDVGKLTVETENISIDADYCAAHAGFVAGDFVMLGVSDDGAGIDPETQNRIFEPFFTTKGLGRGTGLGLSTVYGIVKQNNGFINLYSEPGEGTTFKIYLPKYGGPPVAAQRTIADGDLHGHGETIMVVEDDRSTLRLVERILTAFGYRVIVAAGSLEALEIADREPISLLLTDVVLPEISGHELADRLTHRYPDMKCLYMSGYTADVIAHRGVLQEGFQLIQKPFSKNDLAAGVRRALST